MGTLTTGRAKRRCFPEAMRHQETDGNIFGQEPAMPNDNRYLKTQTPAAARPPMLKDITKVERISSGALLHPRPILRIGISEYCRSPRNFQKHNVSKNIPKNWLAQIALVDITIINIVNST
jgi:hypothetical protein